LTEQLSIKSSSSHRHKASQLIRSNARYHYESILIERHAFSSATAAFSSIHPTIASAFSVPFWEFHKLTQRTIRREGEKIDSISYSLSILLPLFLSSIMGSKEPLLQIFTQEKRKYMWRLHNLQELKPCVAREFPLGCWSRERDIGRQRGWKT